MQSKLARLAKWNLHRFYSRYPDIAKYLPPTMIFNPSTLSNFLNKYNSVYIKANTQHTGKGIIKAWRAAKHYKFVRVKGKANHASTPSELYHKILNSGSKTTYIIQKTIDLAQINGRPFDIRVMMMRDGKRKWHYAGMVVKVAGEQSIVASSLFEMRVPGNTGN